MTTKETGGPAFPSANDVWVGNVGTQGHPGMTLRDWFAGQALVGPVAIRFAQYDAQEIASIGGTEWAAGLAYSIADSMLKARGE